MTAEQARRQASHADRAGERYLVVRSGRSANLPLRFRGRRADVLLTRPAGPATERVVICATSAAELIRLGRRLDEMAWFGAKRIDVVGLVRPQDNVVLSSAGETVEPAAVSRGLEAAEQHAERAVRRVASDLSRRLPSGCEAAARAAFVPPGGLVLPSGDASASCLVVTSGADGPPLVASSAAPILVLR